MMLFAVHLAMAVLHHEARKLEEPGAVVRGCIVHDNATG